MGCGRKRGRAGGRLGERQGEGRKSQQEWEGKGYGEEDKVEMGKGDELG
jgi:hypothetical protein